MMFNISASNGFYSPSSAGNFWQLHVAFRVAVSFVSSSKFISPKQLLHVSIKR